MIDVIGWICMVLFLGSYLLVSNEFIEANSYWYQVPNFIGAIGFAFASAVSGLWFIFTLEIFWGGNAIYRIWKISRKKKVDSWDLVDLN